ncbi:type II toxin-antitoxin system prevent-host-death family antitoxin [Niveispirillum sp. SYP-B3756]|uniref:type II toxin-antitoxin system prevent-host-death family antitoxin n=1 Tax=Niveispirillum sp. SYP-B3756 TaxID=2662178 RepID=UPI00129169AC|nr:type II toxin-antitoxin system prevent-host-death family antitoxin [Niveispirillum sp. SYP-B3756]MQP67073.1 type II toxin-antitoxin system prevent-host-death family antitoxin [Niveispirillum sp. SYP-B3756]
MPERPPASATPNLSPGAAGPAVPGDRLAIAKDCTPIAPLASTPHTGFKIGILQGEAGDAPDFLDPLDAEELALWEGHP